MVMLAHLARSLSLVGGIGVAVGGGLVALGGMGVAVGREPQVTSIRGCPAAVENDRKVRVGGSGRVKCCTVLVTRQISETSASSPMPPKTLRAIRTDRLSLDGSSMSIEKVALFAGSVIANGKGMLSIRIILLFGPLVKVQTPSPAKMRLISRFARLQKRGKINPIS
jgi:hypothetical protein